MDVTALRAETIEDDLRARDFTVNAIAVPLEGGDPIDPTGGLADAEARLLRAASERAFADDPLRLLRAPRLAARYEPRAGAGHRRAGARAGRGARPSRPGSGSSPSCAAMRRRAATRCGRWRCWTSSS